MGGSLAMLRHVFSSSDGLDNLLGMQLVVPSHPRSESSGVDLIEWLPADATTIAFIPALKAADRKGQAAITTSMSRSASDAEASSGSERTENAPHFAPL